MARPGRQQMRISARDTGPGRRAPGLRVCVAGHEGIIGHRLHV